jgi:FecR protein
MNRRPVASLFTTLLIGASLALSLSSPAFAQEEQPNIQLQAAQIEQPATVSSRIARLSFTQGDVQVQRPDEDWQSASINMPLQQGFRVATTDGRAEIQFESGLILRLAEDSILEFTELDNGQNSGRITKLNLTQGTIIVTADLRPTDSFSVDAPNVQVTVFQPSRFRVDTTQGDSWVGIFAGDVMVKTETGETKVTKGHTFHISGADPNQVSIDMNAAADDFDQWAADRDHSIQQGYRDAVQYVANFAPDYSEYNYGMSDLSSYGHWVVVAGSGLCWEPYGVPDHWRPFFFGRWEFFHGAGWTWISSEPWGWLPFHTGHWFTRPGGGWMWQPGPIRAWNPAPVHWFNVGNQLGWAPKGTLNSHGQPPASGIVVGTREERGIKIQPGVRAPLASELAGTVTPTKTPAPAPVLRTREFREGSPTETLHPSRPINFPAEGAVRFDPATRTYVNSHPPEKPMPPFRPRVNDGRGIDAPVERQSGQRPPVNPKPAQPPTPQSGAVPQFRPTPTQPTASVPPPHTVQTPHTAPVQTPTPPQQPTQMQRPIYVPPAQPHPPAQQPAPQPHYIPAPAQPASQPHYSPPPAAAAPAAQPHTAPTPAPAAAPTATPIRH